MWFKDLFKTEVSIKPCVVPDSAKLVVLRLEDKFSPEVVRNIRDQITGFHSNNNIQVPLMVLDSMFRLDWFGDDDLKLMGLMRIPEQIPDIYSESTCKPILDNE